MESSSPLVKNAPPATTSQKKVPEVVVKDPAWWRGGSVPLLVLVMVVAAVDLAWPRSEGIGLGAALGCFLAINALLLLRRDFSKGEYWFLQGLACVNMLALFCSGHFINWFTCLILPFIVVMLPTTCNYAEKSVRYRNWWTFWVAKRSTGTQAGRFAALRSLLPLLICIVIGICCFLTFLVIFATGNPLVEQIFDIIADWWNKLLNFLHLSWDFWLHVVYWIIGFIWFGFYCFMRPVIVKLPNIPSAETSKSTGSTILPYLPLCVLLGVNAAFAIATSTDIAFLWFGKVPEGISQTAYLHEGATSITWAAVLAAALLVLLFRRNGVARRGKVSRLFGYILVAQTALLAVSVYMRLYHQIEDFGFTVRRLQAAEAMLMGLAGLVVLVFYMCCNGGFWQYAKICLGVMVLMLIVFVSYSPARLAGNLNLMYVNSHPHWNFSVEDFSIGRFDEKENLAFAEYVFNKAKAEGKLADENSFGALTEKKLHYAAHKIEERAAAGSWLNYNLNFHEDIPAAERIIGTPITIKLVESED